MDEIKLETKPVENQTGRLDKFLVSCFPDYSRNQFIHLIEAGAVQVLGHPERILKADSKILKGDIYTIIPPEPVEADPKPEDIPLLDTDPASVRANAYDMVINGVEVGGGSIRITNTEVQKRMFKAIGLTDEQAQNKFGYLLNAFDYSN